MKPWRNVPVDLFDGNSPVPLNIVSAIAKLAGPERRIMDIPAAPGAVEIAAIVSGALVTMT